MGCTAHCSLGALPLNKLPVATGAGLRDRYARNSRCGGDAVVLYEICKSENPMRKVFLPGFDLERCAADMPDAAEQPVVDASI